MEYLGMFIGALLVILLIGGLIYFFGSILRAALFPRHDAGDRADAARDEASPARRR